MDTAFNKLKRETIIKRIQALMAKTVENGCTEAEATFAAQKVDELMREHDLAYTDVVKEIRADKYGKRRRPFVGGTARRRSLHESQFLIIPIGEYFDCKGKFDGLDLVYFGEESDTEMAHNMLDMLRTAMDGEWGRYQRSQEARMSNFHGRTLRASFMQGMYRRLAERIRELKAERTKAEAKASTTGTALVVLTKKQVLAEKMQAAGFKVGQRSVRKSVGSKAAYNAGTAAGSRVNLGTGSIGSGSAGRIGRG